MIRATLDRVEIRRNITAYFFNLTNDNPRAKHTELQIMLPVITQEDSSYWGGCPVKTDYMFQFSDVAEAKDFTALIEIDAPTFAKVLN